MGKNILLRLWNGEILIYDYLAKTSKVIGNGFGSCTYLAFASLGKLKSWQLVHTEKDP